MSANPELHDMVSQERLPERQMEDELEQGIPYQFRDCELEAESPFCSSTRKYSEEVREERQLSPSRDDLTMW
jgi:hypothetical protein